MLKKTPIHEMELLWLYVTWEKVSKKDARASATPREKAEVSYSLFNMSPQGSASRHWVIL